MSFNHVPHDILSEILMNPKLAIEDIVRCAFVCKSWYSLVISPAFVSLHSTQQRFDSISKNKKKGLFLVIENDKRFSLNLDDNSLSKYKRLEIPSKNPKKFKVVDCLNGVVCMSNYEDGKIVLWNPSIKKLLKLPKPHVPLDSSCLFRSIGFGYDAATNDFKVVRALVSWRKKIIEHHAEVYESSVGRWRRINNKSEAMDDWSTSCRVRSEMSNQAFINGVVHRVGASLNTGIVSFDFQNEVFGRMDVPDDLLAPDQYSKYDVRVSVIGEESLSLILTHKLHDPGEKCVVWLMREYGVVESWTKLYMVSTPRTPWEILCEKWNDKPLVKRPYERWLYSYVPGTKHIHRHELFPSYKYVVFNFTQSVALLGVKHVMKPETETRRPLFMTWICR